MRITTWFYLFVLWIIEYVFLILILAELELKGFHDSIEFIMGCLLFSLSTKAPQKCINPVYLCVLHFSERERGLGEKSPPAKRRQRHLGSWLPDSLLGVSAEQSARPRHHTARWDGAGSPEHRLQGGPLLIAVHAGEHIAYKGDNYRPNIMHLLNNLRWPLRFGSSLLCYTSVCTHTHKCSSKTGNSGQLLNMQIIHLNRFVKHMQSLGMSLIKLHAALLIIGSLEYHKWLHVDNTFFTI